MPPPGLSFIGSVERAGNSKQIEVNGVCLHPGWERIAVQIDSGAVDTVGPKEIAGAFDMKETVMSKKGIGFVAANGSSIKNYGEKRIAGYTDDGEGVSLKIQCADVRSVLGSVHKMHLGGNVVALDGDRSYTQNKETRRRTRIVYDQGKYVMRVWVPSKESAAKMESEKVLKGNKFAILATESGEGFARRV